MAEGGIDWEEILSKKYPSYRVEVMTYLDTVHISRSTDVSIDKIYSVIVHDPNVSENLKLMYHETLYGTNKEVKQRIRNRIANFRRSLK